MKCAVIYIIYLSFVCLYDMALLLCIAAAPAPHAFSRLPSEWPSHISLIIKVDINDNVATTVQCAWRYTFLYVCVCICG